MGCAIAVLRGTRESDPGHPHPTKESLGSRNLFAFPELWVILPIVSPKSCSSGVRELITLALRAVRAPDKEQLMLSPRNALSVVSIAAILTAVVPA